MRITTKLPELQTASKRYECTEPKCGWGSTSEGNCPRHKEICFAHRPISYFADSVQKRERAIAKKLKEIEQELLYHNTETDFGNGIQIIRDLRKELEN